MLLNGIFYKLLLSRIFIENSTSAPTRGERENTIKECLSLHPTMPGFEQIHSACFIDSNNDHRREVGVSTKASCNVNNGHPIKRKRINDPTIIKLNLPLLRERVMTEPIGVKVVDPLALWSIQIERTKHVASERILLALFAFRLFDMRIQVAKGPTSPKNNNLISARYFKKRLDIGIPLNCLPHQIR